MISPLLVIIHIFAILLFSGVFLDGIKQANIKINIHNLPIMLLFLLVTGLFDIWAIHHFWVSLSVGAVCSLVFSVLAVRGSKLMTNPPTPKDMIFNAIAMLIIWPEFFATMALLQIIFNHEKPNT